MQGNVTGEQAPPVYEAKERDSLQAENTALRDRLLRALADAENTRQRGERMAKDARQYAIADFARELLTVLDNLHRAIAAAEQRRADMTDDSSLLEGIKATERILTSTLERFAVRRVEALGAKFDPALHEAVMQVEDDEHDPGTVMQVLEDGYVIHERLLRPARVTVARRRQERASHSEAVKPRDHDGFHHFET
ncbi:MULTISPECIES: nucleotide exchange factor GrpE [unclassified Bradyrhizobium]|uniref:nucleotide exchange factor GrpE n=1 Tax=unclassified Bradyrhizobium TaxID=2631580 RepID=UPI001FF9DE49|nr:MULTISPECIES: nucleotide exchange factor GrpE [unclassified Bradyrhizobium]MCK1537489.1 nucleotide exchange factor GrpE [Bradyrhizobium sp. 176]MCK1554877.1 nucleotide exchange factor GrpE [Bradyrhizobium sp. 171]MCK1700190.1 nucleotide exchange factor GrpE [Bradyrhizobium sp. 146]UPJ28954.1 nucleotide exchange factor GrpE [Bradyrhizobium sp. CW1]UPK11202.1 nucleotide exchange factor GrpE [Bradyrhizobium sp. 155]